MPASESEHRIRAIVRVMLSRGVWLIILLQLTPLLLSADTGEATAGSALLRALVVAIGVAALLYLTAGVSHAVVQSREPVDIGQAVRAGTEVYGQFLWLMLKIGVVVGLVANLALLLMRALLQWDTAVLIERAVYLYPLVVPLLAFIFVYWLPIVFVERNFQLWPTLRASVVMARQRLSQAGFLAVLTLTPALGHVLLGDPPALAGVVVLQVAGGLLSWVAYVYCVERLLADLPASPA
jgi:hypothetical protein